MEDKVSHRIIDPVMVATIAADHAKATGEKIKAPPHVIEAAMAQAIGRVTAEMELLEAFDAAGLTRR